VQAGVVDGVAVLTRNQPAVRNATGAGSAFCTGGDISSMQRRIHGLIGAVHGL
jgi:enoyl-CoA hydratase/carnithine racemase